MRERGKEHSPCSVAPLDFSGKGWGSDKARRFIAVSLKTKRRQFTEKLVWGMWSASIRGCPGLREPGRGLMPCPDRTPVPTSCLGWGRVKGASSPLNWSSAWKIWLRFLLLILFCWSPGRGVCPE